MLAAISATHSNSTMQLVLRPSPFRLQSDDGFVAYLNGEEAGRSLAPSEPDWNSTTEGGAGRPGGDTAVINTPVVIDLTSLKNRVQNGLNVIAIHGLNSSAGGSDFLVRPSLDVTHIVTPSPLAINTTQTITARTFDGATWSAPESVTLILSEEGASAENLVVSEIIVPSGGSQPGRGRGRPWRCQFVRVSRDTQHRWRPRSPCWGWSSQRACRSIFHSR